MATLYRPRRRAAASTGRSELRRQVEVLLPRVFERPVLRDRRALALAPDLGEHLGEERSREASGDRLGITTVWRGAQGNTGVGNAVELTPGTGYFWFFDSANVETVVKVLAPAASDLANMSLSRLD